MSLELAKIVLLDVSRNFQRSFKPKYFLKANFEPALCILTMDFLQRLFTNVEDYFRPEKKTSMIFTWDCLGHLKKVAIFEMRNCSYFSRIVYEM